MRFSNVCVEGVARHLPDNVVTSEELEQRMSPLYERLKLPMGRLELMSGIKERRFWDEGVMPSEVGAIAGEKVIEKTGFDRSRIGCLINASVCRDFLEPATASVVHNKLQLPVNTEVLDISNACLGVLNGMVHIANMIELGHIEAGLVVAGENGGPLVCHTIDTLLARTTVTRKEIKSSFASLTIGSAAVGVLLTHKNISRTGHRLLGGVSCAATQFNNLCRGNNDMGSDSNWSPLMETDAETLMQEGCRLAGETWSAFKSTMDWKNEDIDRVFCHQVGIMHRKLLYETIGLGLDKDFSTLDILGNTGAASLPVTLAMGEEKGVLPTGSKAALLGIGSGLNCLMLGVEW
jgi:3-oxoacyl-[acyl-carrier-protein] synthase III